MNSCGSPSNDESPSVPKGLRWHCSHVMKPPSTAVPLKNDEPCDSENALFASTSSRLRIGFGGRATLRMKFV